MLYADLEISLAILKEPNISGVFRQLVPVLGTIAEVIPRNSSSQPSHTADRALAELLPVPSTRWLDFLGGKPPRPHRLNTCPQTLTPATASEGDTMSDKNPHTSERIQDSHHQGGAPFSNPRRSQTSTTVQHAQEESPAQNSLPPQDAGPDAHTQTSQAAQDPQDAKTQESAQKSAEDSPAESAHAAQSTPWGSQTSKPQPAEAESAQPAAVEIDTNTPAEALPQSISRPDADEAVHHENTQTRQLPVQSRPEQGPLSSYLSEKPQDSEAPEPAAAHAETLEAEPADNIPQSISRPDADEAGDAEDVRTRQLPAQAQEQGAFPSIADTMSAARAERGSSTPADSAASEAQASTEKTGAKKVYEDTMPASAIPIITANTPAVSVGAPASGQIAATTGAVPAGAEKTPEQKRSRELKTIVTVTAIRTVLLAACLVMYGFGFGGGGTFNMMLGYGGAVYMLVQIAACIFAVRSKSTKGMRILNGISAGLGIILLIVTAIVYAGWSGEDSSAGAYIFIMADIILSVIIASARSIIEQPKDDVEPERLARE